MQMMAKKEADVAVYESLDTDDEEDHDRLLRKQHDANGGVGLSLDDAKLGAPSPVRRGFVRIYFESDNFTSSTVLRVEEQTLVRDVRQTMATKLHVSRKQLEYYAILMVFASGKGSSMSARTLQDEESILQAQEQFHAERQSLPEISLDHMGPVRVKPRHRARQTLKFVFKDTRAKPIDLDADLEPRTSNTNSQDTVFAFPQKLGQGIRSGTLKKASLKDANVWRTRWFVLKEDKLFYCKSEMNQRDITAIPLLNSCIVKADVQIPHCFELHTSRRVYRLCAASDDLMVGWIHALHREIRLCSENQALSKAEIIIVDETVTTCELQNTATPFAVTGILSNPVLRKLFRDYMVQHLAAKTVLLDTWTECEAFRHNGITRYQHHINPSVTNPTLRSTARDEWEHVKTILLQYLPASQKAGAELSDVDMDVCRTAFHESQKNRRLSIAMDTETNNLLENYPSPHLFYRVQHDVLRALEEGPFRHFIAGKGYMMIVDRMIRR
ncbi:hypothetical protein SPRG_09033 [Saprolegnia parasitica CBS 223.65]|uniref:PH domain-containing protein n=1 Tax=Saprolegnia parasitica (strain CBS 223.65) TaxID=695850 RepID=A0A067C4Q4_SAPPC|nr:hypothetical protein SPRG_09033 [Saprolegnia parasitica CBS 223.65]KDO25734.1 hypothetical protein SPRG_09033 [Saprolegnia parasitica CBS 223.65]|eukprot:XP_012203543.1 hypothetical protein SPRG_09033 [Saprolegnia parasitica CBS 223.65]